MDPNAVINLSLSVGDAVAVVKSNHNGDRKFTRNTAQNNTLLLNLHNERLLVAHYILNQICTLSTDTFILMYEEVGISS